jgi:hypothetical protein
MYNLFIVNLYTLDVYFSYVGSTYGGNLYTLDVYFSYVGSTYGGNRTTYVTEVYI